jgi:transcriptional regulator with XRE-family HTH domain
MLKDIADKAEAMRVYARQAKNPQLEADAWEIRKRAEDRALSAALDIGRQRDDTGRLLPTGGKQAKAEVLREAGISTSTANRYEQFNRLPAGEKEARIAKGRAAIVRRFLQPQRFFDLTPGPLDSKIAHRRHDEDRLENRHGLVGYYRANGSRSAKARTARPL